MVQQKLGHKEALKLPKYMISRRSTVQCCLATVTRENYPIATQSDSVSQVQKCVLYSQYNHCLTRNTIVMVKLSLHGY